ncbi:MAG: DUF3489 domain-containing protein [Magnetococcales bacterium]|nr:DUF3489 domain-containing protein [Magnetococcales bacterium]
MAKLSKSQQRILETAAERDDGSIFPLPTKMPPVAQQMVMEALVRKGMIDEGEEPHITDAGYRAIGQEPPTQPEPEAPTHEEQQPEQPSEESTSPESNPLTLLFEKIALEHFDIDTLETRNSDDLDFHDVSACGVKNALEAAFQAGLESSKTARKTGPRKNTKQARTIELMKRPQGATIEQISEETGWNSNTIRGVISGALRKRLGLDVTSVRTREGSSSISTYYIEEEEKAAEPAEA